MRGQDRKVQGPNPSLSRETDRPDMVVICQIRDQEQARGPKGRDHADLVRGDLLPTYEKVPDGQQDRAGAIEYSIDGGQDREREYDYFSCNRAFTS